MKMTKFVARNENDFSAFANFSQHEKLKRFDKQFGLNCAMKIRERRDAKNTLMDLSECNFVSNN